MHVCRAGEAHAATEPGKQRKATMPEPHAVAAAAVPHSRVAAAAVPHPRVAATAVLDPRPATVPEAQSEPSTTAEPTTPGGATTKDRKPKVIEYASAHPSVKAGLDIAMETEWQKYSDFNAVVVCPPDQRAELRQQGHRPVPTKWAHMDKHEHLVGTANYQPKHKARLVSCGNFMSVAEGGCIRSDSPTAPEGISILCSYAASRMLRLKSADITNAYLQGRPLRGSRCSSRRRIRAFRTPLSMREMSSSAVFPSMGR